MHLSTNSEDKPRSNLALRGLRDLRTKRQELRQVRRALFVLAILASSGGSAGRASSGHRCVSHSQLQRPRIQSAKARNGTFKERKAGEKKQYGCTGTSVAIEEPNSIEWTKRHVLKPSRSMSTSYISKQPVWQRGKQRGAELRSARLKVRLKMRLAILVSYSYSCRGNGTTYKSQNIKAHQGNK